LLFYVLNHNGSLEASRDVMSVCHFAGRCSYSLKQSARVKHTGPIRPRRNCCGKPCLLADVVSKKKLYSNDITIYFDDVIAIANCKIVKIAITNCKIVIVKIY